MLLTDIMHKTCLIGLSYYDSDGTLLKQSQLAGEVINANTDDGIDIELQSPSKTGADKLAIFTLPATLSTWFLAPPGHYRNTECNINILNPDYLVTWDVHKTQQATPEGQHEWWEWRPRTAPPQVGG